MSVSGKITRRLNLVGSAPPDEPAPGGAQRLGELDWVILMSRAQAGDKVAYRRLLDEITPYIRWRAGKAFSVEGDREDVVQETLLTVHAIRNTYDPGRPFGPWLVAIANRRVVDGLRRQGRRRARETELEEEHEQIAHLSAASPGEAGDAQLLRQAVSSLPPAQQQAVQLLKLGQMSLKEASAASGMTIASLKVATHRAIKSLRRALKGES